MKQESKKIGRLSDKTNMKPLCPIWKSWEAIRQEVRGKESGRTRGEASPRWSVWREPLSWKSRPQWRLGSRCYNLPFLPGCCRLFLGVGRQEGARQSYCSLALRPHSPPLKALLRFVKDAWRWEGHWPWRGLSALMFFCLLLLEVNKYL